MHENPVLGSDWSQVVVVIVVIIIIVIFVIIIVVIRLGLDYAKLVGDKRGK